MVRPRYLQSGAEWLPVEMLQQKRTVPVPGSDYNFMAMKGSMQKGVPMPPRVSVYEKRQVWQQFRVEPSGTCCAYWYSARKFPGSLLGELSGLWGICRTLFSEGGDGHNGSAVCAWHDRSSATAEPV